MVQNVIETDTAEVTSYLSIYLISFLVVFGGIPSILIAKVKISYKPFFRECESRIKVLSFCVFAIFLVGTFFYSDYASVGRNHRELVSYITPYKMYDALFKYARNTYLYPPLSFEKLDTNPIIERPSERRHVTVLVLGETARAQSFSLNGYLKQTNLYTQSKNVISFKNVTSCGTATAISVPCMFSRQNKENYNERRAKTQQNVIDIIQSSGADVL